MIFFDPLYLLLALPALVISLAASALLNYWNSKYSNIANARGVTGKEASRLIADRHRFAISYAETGAKLGDNYNPGADILTLSREVANVPSIAAVAIAAHEMGHVQQDFGKSFLLSARSVLVPMVNIGSNLGYFLVIAGLLLSVSDLAWVGLALFSLSAVFTILTLPIEIDASRRAMNFIRELNLLSPSETAGARNVLIGAALTYVAAVAASLGNLLYFFLQVRGISSRD